jgi:ataxia telangiectasia mutated family protein
MGMMVNDTSSWYLRPLIPFSIGSNAGLQFKGEFRDDLRQDAVMEQVFDLVNRVLRQDRETRRRELRVRDYKVIPLSSHAGMMEFVDNTMPLSGWLGNAHRRYFEQLSIFRCLQCIRYRPRDIATTTGQKIMREAQDTKKPELMLQRYLELCKKIKPVMRHYFTERFKDPMAWFTMRLHYTRSAATTSIVGHVLGLGDRHTSNILIDKSNGELVHIDLGISFDQVIIHAERIITANNLNNRAKFSQSQSVCHSA